MTAKIRLVTFDCADPYALSRFWTEVTGFRGEPEDPSLPGQDEALLVGDGFSLLFIRVPEGKSVKNRIHLDLMPTDRLRDEEVERLLGLGATMFADHRRPDGTGWATLLDPEGNEFCVERSQAERDGG